MSQETVSAAQYSSDISARCGPLTFVKTKLLLENMAPGEVACIRLSAGSRSTICHAARATKAVVCLNFGPNRSPDD